MTERANLIEEPSGAFSAEQTEWELRESLLLNTEEGLMSYLREHSPGMTIDRYREIAHARMFVLGVRNGSRKFSWPEDSVAFRKAIQLNGCYFSSFAVGVEWVYEQTLREACQLYRESVLQSELDGVKK